jgi:hypothetical protein
MTPIELLALAAAALVAATLVMLTLSTRARLAWWLPALAALLFLGYSVATVAVEGPLAVWPAISASWWSNQIWMDLLLAVAIGWVLILPRARELGMQPLPWLVLVLGSGSIGFLLMLSRLLYLQASRGDTAA